jgi:hypothetical protein
MKKKLLVLISNSSGQRQQVANQDRALTVLKAQDIDPELVDGSDPSQRDRRNELFGISGNRGKYPQFFLVEGSGGTTSFLGLFEDIEAMNDSRTLTKQALGLGEDDNIPAQQPSPPAGNEVPADMYLLGLSIGPYQSYGTVCRLPLA